MKTKTGNSSSGYKKKSIFKIKKAISRFISNTQKIVQKVKPEAKIIVAKKASGGQKTADSSSFLSSDKARNTENNPRVIRVPDFNEIRISDISDAQVSSENTDSEAYEEIHNALEQNEYFVRARPEIRKVKANGRSTEKIHLKGKTRKNLEKNLGKLEKLVPNEVIHDYFDEGIHYLSWPVSQPSDVLTLSFTNLS